MVVTASVLLTVAVLAPPESSKGIAGDPALVRLVQAAQQTNRAAYPRGALRGTVLQKLTPAGRSIDQSDTRLIQFSVVWDGAKSFWDLSESGSLTEPGGRVTPLRGHHLKIERPDQNLRLSYDPENLRLARIKESRRGDESLLHLLPDQMWFRSAKRLWTDVFDDSIFTPDRFAGRSIHREGEQIIYEHTFLLTGGKLRLVFSMEAGGNIVSAEERPASDGKGYSQTKAFKWARHPSGLWYLKHYTRKSTYAAAGKPQGQEEYVLDVTEFDPNPTIAPDRFEEKSLHVAQGTMVHEYGKKGEERSFRIGQKKDADAARLDKLSEEVRSRGFAKPDQAKSDRE